MSNCMPIIGSSVGGLTAGKLVNAASIGNTTYALGCLLTAVFLLL